MNWYKRAQSDSFASMEDGVLYVSFRELSQLFEQHGIKVERLIPFGEHGFEVPCLPYALDGEMNDEEVGSLLKAVRSNEFVEKAWMEDDRGYYLILIFKQRIVILD